MNEPVLLVYMFSVSTFAAMFREGNEPFHGAPRVVITDPEAIQQIVDAIQPGSWKP